MVSRARIISNYIQGKHTIVIYFRAELERTIGDPMAISWIAFACIFGGVLLGQTRSLLL
jgi:hypothetical protein